MCGTAEKNICYYPNLLDYLRVLGISFVLLGHLYYEPESIGKKFDAWIYTFHMPLFFFISGLFHKDGFKKNLNALLSMVFVFLLFNIPYVLKNPEYVSAILKFKIPNVPTWFFLTLGGVKLICYKITYMRGSILVLISLIFIVLYHNYRFTCHQYLLSFSMAIPFYVLTALYKDYLVSMTRKKWLMFIFISLSVGCSLLHGRCDMYQGIYWRSILLYVLMAYFAILPLYSFSEYLWRKVRPNEIIFYLSRTTGFIVATHYMITTSFRKIELGGIVVNVIISVALLLLYYPICKWVYSRARFLIGKVQFIK